MHKKDIVSSAIRSDENLDVMVEQAKEQRKKERERRYNFDDRYKNKADKNTKGPVPLLADCHLFNHNKTTPGTILQWFPEGWTKHADFEKYELYRRLCRSFYISGNWFKVVCLGVQYGFVDIRNVERVGRKKIKSKLFDIIYNDELDQHLIKAEQKYIDVGIIKEFSEVFMKDITSPRKVTYRAQLGRDEELQNILHYPEVFGDAADLLNADWVRVIEHPDLVVDITIFGKFGTNSGRVQGIEKGMAKIVLESRGFVFVSSVDHGYRSVTYYKAQDLRAQMHRVWDSMSKASEASDKLSNLATALENNNTVVKLDYLVDKTTKAVDTVSNNAEQTFNKFNTVLSSMNGACLKHHQVATTINNSANLFNRKLNEFGELADAFRNVLMPCRNFIGSNNGLVLDLILDIGLLVTNIIKFGMDQSWLFATSVLNHYFNFSGVATLVFNSMVVQKFMNLAHNLIGYRAQMGVDCLPKITSALTMFGLVIGSVIRSGQEFSVELFTDIIAKTAVWSNKVFVGGRNAFKSITEMFEEYFDDILVYFGYGPITPLGKLKVEIKQFHDFVLKVTSVEHLNEIYGDATLLSELQDWIKRGRQIEFCLKDVKDSNLSVQFRSELNWLVNWHTKHVTVAAAPINNRARPVCIMLQGTGGVGKSCMANILANDILKHHYGIDTSTVDFRKKLRKTMVYEYRTDPNDVDAYMNGLNKNHKIMIWSEAFQCADKFIRPSRDICTLMAAVDTAGWQVPQAFESKGKIPFEIPFIIITTNLDGIVHGDSMNWKSLHAINRRFDFIYKCVAKESCKAISGFLNPAKIRTDSDAVTFYPAELEFKLGDDGKEAGVTWKPCGTAVPYYQVFHTLVKTKMEYDATFRVLDEMEAACSSTISSMEDYRSYELTQRVPLRAQMVKEDEEPLFDAVDDEIRVEVKFVEPPKFPKLNEGDDILDTAPSWAQCTFKDLKPKSLNSILKQLSRMVDHSVDSFHCICNSRMGHESFFVKQLPDNSLRVVVDNKYTILVDVPAYWRNLSDKDDALFTDFFMHCLNFCPEIARVGGVVNTLWILECLLQPSTIWGDDIVKYECGDLSAFDLEIYHIEKKIQTRNKALKVLAGVFGGVLALVGAVAAGYYLFKSGSSSTATKEFEPVPETVEDIVAQSEKSVSVPQQSKVSLPKAHVIPIKPQSEKSIFVPQQQKILHPKGHVVKIDKTKVITNLRSQNERMKAEVEGALSDVDGDYGDYYAQSYGVRPDPDGNNLRALVWHNTVCVYICDKDWVPTIRVGNALFVSSRTAIMPKHYMERLEGNRFCLFRLQSNSSWAGMLTNKGVIVTPGPPELDLMSIHFPDVMQFPNIIKHFVNLDDLGKFKNVPAVLTTVAPVRKQVADAIQVLLYIKEFHIMNAEAKDISASYEGLTPDKTYFIRNGYSYDCATQDGDCGAALVAICRELPRKLIGMHVCGTGAWGCSVSLYKELILSLVPTTEKLLAQGFSPEVLFNHINNGEIKDPYYKWKRFVLGGEVYIGSTSEFLGSCFCMGRSIYSGKHSETSRIEPSIIQHRKDLDPKLPWEPEKLPAVVTGPDVKAKSFAKLHADFGYIDLDLLEDCAEDAFRCVYNNPFWKNYARILSVNEAIFGSIKGREMDGLPFDPFMSSVKSINLNSSPGKVWEKKRKGGLRGKRTWFNLDTGWVDPEMLKAIDEQWELWRQCIRQADVFSGENKVELRKPPKHLDPRMYNSGDVVTLINSKRLFAGICALLQHDCIQTGVTVGLDCHTQFRALMMRIQEKGLKVFAGDFNKFDGRLRAQLLEVVMRHFIYFYKNAGISVDIQMRMFTFSNIVRFYVCIINGEFILLYKGNPSGNFLTTQLNSFCVKVGGRMCWMHIFKDNWQFGTLVSYNVNVVEIANGDDNVFNVSDRVVACFNQISVAKAFEEVLGMVYTDAAKTGELKPFEHIEDIEYLKRSITNTDAGKLDLVSIRESVLWYKRGVSSHDNFACTISSALHEMFHHGKDMYNAFRNSLLTKLNGTEFSKMGLLTYDAARLQYLEHCSNRTGFGFTY